MNESYAGRKTCPICWIVLGLIIVAVLLAGGYAYWRFFANDGPVEYANVEEHFKYGSTGGERVLGFPFWIWQALPQVCGEFLPVPGGGYESLGLIFEAAPDGTKKDLPIGMSQRRDLGISRTFLNCAACHTGTVRDTPQSVPKVYTGMPGNKLDMMGFQRFLFDCGGSVGFSREYIIPEVERLMQARGEKLDLIDRYVVYPLAVFIMRERLLSLKNSFEWVLKETEWGPGRVDTFNPPKAGYFHYPSDKIPENELHAPVDLPSIWNQRQKTGMHLHWDGNNANVVERNKNAAFATGATPPTFDHASMRRIETWLLDFKQPTYPYPIDEAKAARGGHVYAEYCAGCHGANGQEFPLKEPSDATECVKPGESEDIYGREVGKITRLEEIGTDRRRLDSFSTMLAVNMGTPYAGTPYRFCHYRKTFGYANLPLDGLWLRAPYLHNGSVPSLRDLFEPGDQRPKTFYRGYDVYDPKNVGFVSNVAEENGRQYFLFDTATPGNDNHGHEGKYYGTELSSADKTALVEFLKTF